MNLACFLVLTQWEIILPWVCEKEAMMTSNLIVDDQLDMRKLDSEEMRDMGCKVESVEDL